MKTYFFIFLFLIGSLVTSFGQNDSLEKKFALDKFSKGELTAVEFNDLAKKWRDKIKSINGYPDLPLDQNNQVYFAYQFGYKGMLKSYIFNRVMEWISINYGPDASKYYSNPSEGKIIFYSNFSFNMEHTEATGSASINCIQTAIVTIRDEKMLVELSNFNYYFTSPGYFADDENGKYWVPEKNGNYQINSIYPVINKQINLWDSLLEILGKTKKEVENHFASLDNYIINYSNNYNF
jgi:hypothetical protein